MRDTAQRFWIATCAACALALFSATACSMGATEGAPSSAVTSADAPISASAAASTTPGGLTAFQVEHGIGPVTSPMSLNGVDKTMATSGSKVFEEKCAACHKMAERYVGPALGDVTRRRTPAFVMNMMLNPQEMVEKHPETKKLLAQFFVPMPNQNLSPDEARQVLEYLRTQAP